MKEIKIEPRIMEALGLSAKEMRVFNVFLARPSSKSVSQIAGRTSLARATIYSILRRLEKRKLIKKILFFDKTEWIYAKGLEKYKIMPAVEDSDKKGLHN